MKNIIINTKNGASRIKANIPMAIIRAELRICFTFRFMAFNCSV
ncbi:hypothetical protein [Francisella adeliensis]|nr:hypothetical protein [Francisella adeliensis]